MYWRLITHLPANKWMMFVICLAFATRLYRLDTQSLWFDEIVTVALARMPWYDGFVGLLGQGMQLTPLFHGFIKMWMTLGDPDWFLRLPAVLFGVLSIPLVFKLGELYFNDAIGLLAAFLFAINPFQVWYAQELKLYTLLPLMAAGAMYAFSQMLRTSGKRGLGLLFISNLIGLSAHYFMFLISTVQFFYLLITFKKSYPLLPRWVLAQAVGVIPLLWWWLFIIQQQYFTIGIGWIPAPSWFSPFLTLWNFAFLYATELFAVTVVGLVILLIGLALGVWQARYRPMWNGLMLLWLFFPPLVTLLLSFGRVSFYMDRYLLIVTPVLAVVIAAGFSALRPKALRWTLLLMFIAVTGLGLLRIYFAPVNFRKEDWRTLARHIDARAQPGHRVITCTDGHWLSFEYYNPHEKLAPDSVMFASQVDPASISDRVVWVVHVHQGISIHDLAKTRPPDLDRTLLAPDVAIWETNNLQSITEVSGLTAYQYDVTGGEALAQVVQWHCQD